jgi:hypothetical protein
MPTRTANQRQKFGSNGRLLCVAALVRDLMIDVNNPDTFISNHTSEQE